MSELRSKCLEKMQGCWRMLLHCVYTDFRVESHNVI